jgi:GntR family transcriptional regulator
MEFYIDAYSSIPIVKQIEEQIKLGVLMGTIRSGDTLPSIRDMEKQMGIHHLQIHKAYMAMKRSGLLVLTPGKGTVVRSAVSSPYSMNDKCRKLMRETISKSRRSGISPTAFARYMNWHAQENERAIPFICYVDINQELAEQTSGTISQLWQVPVIGISFNDIKNFFKKKPNPSRLLVPHIMLDEVRLLLSKHRITVIPIEMHYTDQTIKKLSRIKSDASVMLIHLPQPSYRMRFMMTHLRKHMKSAEIKICSETVRPGSGFDDLLKGTRYDHILVGTALRTMVPKELIKDPHILVLDVQIDLKSLEAARIRAGVVI